MRYCSKIKIKSTAKNHHQQLHLRLLYIIAAVVVDAECSVDALRDFFFSWAETLSSSWWWRRRRRAFISGRTLRRLSVGRRTRSINIHSEDSSAAAYWGIYIPVGERSGGREGEGRRGRGAVAVRIDRTASTFDHQVPPPHPSLPPSLACQDVQVDESEKAMDD